MIQFCELLIPDPWRSRFLQPLISGHVNSPSQKGGLFCVVFLALFCVVLFCFCVVLFALFSLVWVGLVCLRILTWENFVFKGRVPVGQWKVDLFASENPAR